MLKIAQIVIDRFKADGAPVNFVEAGGDVLLEIPFKGMNAVLDFSGDNGEYLSLSLIIDSVPEDKQMDVIIACNTMNSMFKWLKFCVDKDNEVMARDDAILAESNAFEETMELMLRAFSIVTQVKPAIMRVIYGS